MTWIKEKLVIITSIKSQPKAQNQRFQFIILVQVWVNKTESLLSSGFLVRLLVILRPGNHVSNPIKVRGPFVVCVKTDLHEGGLEENIRMLNLDETFQNYIHFG